MTADELIDTLAWLVEHPDVRRDHDHEGHEFPGDCVVCAARSKIAEHRGTTPVRRTRG